jgi:hypothetical protein
VFDFAYLENFPAIGDFPGAENMKNEAVFREFFEMVSEVYPAKFENLFFWSNSSLVDDL